MVYTTANEANIDLKEYPEPKRSTKTNDKKIIIETLYEKHLLDANSVHTIDLVLNQTDQGTEHHR